MPIVPVRIRKETSGPPSGCVYPHSPSAFDISLGPDGQSPYPEWSRAIGWGGGAGCAALPVATTTRTTRPSAASAAEPWCGSARAAGHSLGPQLVLRAPGPRVPEPSKRPPRRRSPYLHTASPGREILRDRAALEGERRTVTVLFADAVGFTPSPSAWMKNRSMT